MSEKKRNYIKERIEALPEPERQTELYSIFANCWVTLVDTLDYMEVPFVLTAQFTPEDDTKGRPVAYKLHPGMDPRIPFAAILAREGVAALGNLFPGGAGSKMEPIPVEELGKAQEEIAKLQAGDGHMHQIAMPTFVDTLRDIEIGGEEEAADERAENPV